MRMHRDITNSESVADAEEMQVNRGALHSAIGDTRVLVQDVPNVGILTLRAHIKICQHLRGYCRAVVTSIAVSDRKSGMLCSDHHGGTQLTTRSTEQSCCSGTWRIWSPQRRSARTVTSCEQSITVLCTARCPCGSEVQTFHTSEAASGEVPTLKSPWENPAPTGWSIYSLPNDQPPSGAWTRRKDAHTCGRMWR